MNTAVIVAAGSGTRLGPGRPKQFLEILGKPLLIHTLERFENCPAIGEIVLVLPAGEIEWFHSLAAKYKLEKVLKIVAGGKTRAESVRNGLTAVDRERCEVVAVHDGARPFVTCDEITRTVNKAGETGAACLVGPVTDTIKEVADGKIVRTIERDKLRRALTPQAFRLEILDEAFGLGALDEQATDECYLVERAGHPISVVEGSPANIKVTHPSDLVLAETLLRNFSDRDV